MQRPKHYVFTVSGTGEFPTDMLRYDNCRPLADQDRKIVEAKHGQNDDVLWNDKTGHMRVNHVRLVTDRADLVRRKMIPTVGRWRSFTWSVTKEPTPWYGEE